jgi:ABC-type Mn2+/Zn2+ transport system permease subunit
MKNTIPFTSQVVIEGTAMGVAAGTIGTFVFEKGHAWSPEEMGQAILMAALFK